MAIFKFLKNISSTSILKYNSKHSAVVDHSATGHSWGFTRAIVVNTQRNASKRKIADEALFMKNHSTVQCNKSSFPLSIFKS